MDKYNNFVIRLAKIVSKQARGLLSKNIARRRTGVGHSGDVAFYIDTFTEDLVYKTIKKENLNLAYFSEDKGLVEFGKPEYILIIDPVDGTRPATAGFESCCVSIALAKYTEQPKMKDVVFGCISEIKGDRVFTAQKGKGARILQKGKPVPIRLSKNTNLENLRWSVEFCGRPARIVTRVLGNLMDKSTLSGGYFALASSCFSITRIITGQIDAYVDISNRILQEYPETLPVFKKAGSKGIIVGLFTYDIAAAVLIAKEAGVIITNGFGESFDEVNLLDVSQDNIQSCIAVSNKPLYNKIFKEINRNVSGFKKNT